MNSSARTISNFPFSQNIWLAIAFLVTALYLVSLLFINPDFFYKDDIQLQFMPVFYDIGNALLNGEWKLISLRSWNQGNYIGEYQFALLNPISLILYSIISQFENIANAAILYITFHIYIAVLGGFWLARELEVDPGWSALFGFSIATSSMAMYWFAHSWPPAYVGFAWSLVAVAGLVRLTRRRKGFFVAVLASYLTLVSGWPHSVIALMVVSLILALITLTYDTNSQSRKSILSLSLAIILAGIMSLPAIFPLIEHHQHSLRPISFVNNAALTNSVTGLLGVFHPTFTPFFRSFSVYTIAPAPFYYAGWFILIGISSAKNWEFAVSPKTINRFLFASTLVFLILSLGPEKFGPLRWPIRFVPYFQVFLLLLILRAFTKKGVSFSIPLSILFLLSVSYLDFVAKMSFDALKGIAILAMGLLLTFHMKKSRHLALTMLCFSLAVSAYIHFEYPENKILPNMNIPKGISESRTIQDIHDSTGNTLNLYSSYTVHISDGSSVGGNLPLWSTDARVLNGYSPIQPEGLTEFFCWDHKSAICPQAIERLFYTEPNSGLQSIDLFGVDKVIVEKGEFLNLFEAHKTPNWVNTDSADRLVVFERDKPRKRFGGSISWHSSDIEILSFKEIDSLTESFSIVNKSKYESLIVFARAWYPGYEASFNGMPIQVSALGKILVSVKAPPESTGTLEIQFVPPMWRILIPLSLAALIISIFLAYRFSRGKAT